MNQQDQFYIGWQEKSPTSYASKVRSFVWLLLVIFILSAGLLVLSQKGFEDSKFELGQLTQIEGILVKEPAPMLKVFQNGTINSVVLIGFGKFDALKDLEAIEEEQGSLEGQSITLEGTLIYYKGKTLLELTKGTKAFISKGTASTNFQVTKNTFGDVSLVGEILDPKCALGVMKPGSGKPHRSCAIRCISGGIPPVFRITNEKGEENYCILVGADGERINEAVLPQVADQVRICGQLEQQDDWLVLYANPQTDILTIKPHWMLADIPMCQ